MLFSSEPLPLQAHEQAAIALGIAIFDQQLLMSGGPTGSPLLNFKATLNCVWTLNPDGTLYYAVPWTEAHAWELDKEGDVVVLRGGFVHHEFMRLRLEPMSEYREALVALVDASVMRNV